MSASIADELAEVVGRDHVLIDNSGTFSVDWTRRFGSPGALVVRPGTVDEVRGVVELCRLRGAPLVPQGGNTGLVGGGVPVDGEVVLSTHRFRSIGEVDRASRQVTVGAGVTLASLQEAASAVGLRYPVDFGSRGSATVGGTVATNAGGINVVRYGMTRRQIVGIEAVLGNGQVVSHLSGLVKDNTGYDYASLLCGSEGTLGVVTAVRVGLVAEMAHRVTALIGFGSVATAVEAVGVVCGGSDSVDAAELMLESGVRLVGETFGVACPFAAEVYVLFELSAQSDPTEALESLLMGCRGVTDVAVAVDAVSRRGLWSLRDEHTPAIGTVGVPRKFDVSVPGERLAGFIDGVRLAVESAAPAARVFVFGHAADGNMHVNVVGDADDEAVEEAVLGLVIECGGSVSAEHGVGRLKKAWLPRQRSTAELELMRSIKRAFDPDLILNPHILLDHW